MNHKERVYKCFEHQNTDRVPIDLWLDSSDPKVLENFLKYTNCSSYGELMDLLDIDVFRPKTPVAEKYINEEHESFKCFLPNKDPKHKTYTSEFKRPLGDAEKIADIEKYQWPKPDIFNYNGLLPICENQKERFLWVQAGTWSPIFCRICDLCGMEKTLVDMMLNPGLIEAIIEKLVDFYYNAFKNTLEVGKGVIDAFSFGDDYASQLDMMFDVELWRKFFKKPLRKLCNLIKSYGVLIGFHSCGSIIKIIPDLIELGVDMIFPVQPRAKGMDLKELKKEYGKDLTFYGAIDVQETLPYGTEAQVREEVRKAIRILGENGGYILSSSHTILRDVPIENVLAMLDEARRFC